MSCCCACGPGVCDSCTITNCTLHVTLTFDSGLHSLTFAITWDSVNTRWYGTGTDGCGPPRTIGFSLYCSGGSYTGEIFVNGTGSVSFGLSVVSCSPIDLGGTDTLFPPNGCTGATTWNATVTT